MKIFSFIFIAWAIIANICDAMAIYNTYDMVTSPSYHRYSAYASDIFSKKGKNMIIHIEKCNVVSDYTKEDRYAYAIEVTQRVDQNPFTIKQIMIASESDSVVINAPDTPNRTTGLDLVDDRIVYSYDPGKVNRVIDSVQYKMLIRITTNQNVIYDFYPSSLFIEYAKRVSKWS